MLVHYDNSVREVSVGSVGLWRFLRLLQVVRTHGDFCIAKSLVRDKCDVDNCERNLSLFSRVNAALVDLLHLPGSCCHFAPDFCAPLHQNNWKLDRALHVMIFSLSRCFRCVKACFFCVCFSLCMCIPFSLMLCALHAEPIRYIVAHAQVLPRVLPWPVHPELDLPLHDGDVRLCITQWLT